MDRTKHRVETLVAIMTTQFTVLKMDDSTFRLIRTEDEEIVEIHEADLRTIMKSLISNVDPDSNLVLRFDNRKGKR